MCTTVGQQIAQPAQHQNRSAEVHHSEAGDQSGSVATNAHATGYEANLFVPESITNFMSMADGDDEV